MSSAWKGSSENGSGSKNWFLTNAGMLVSICVVVAGVGISVNAQLYQQREEFRDALIAMKLEMIQSHHAMERRISINEERLVHLPARDRWRGADQIEWANDLEKANRKLDLVVPDPRKIITRNLMDAR